MIGSRALRSFYQHIGRMSYRAVLTTRYLSAGGSLMSSTKLKPSDRIVGHDKNLWVEYAALALEAKAINLGQGFPDFKPPQFVIDALVESTKDVKCHQYTRGPGHTRLVHALAALHSKLQGREINPMTEVVTGVGAYSSLHQCIQGHVNPGDEVILIEPFFDCYNPMIEIAGGKPVFVPLRPSPTADKGNGRFPLSSKDWLLDIDELRGVITSNTKALVINNPNNPIGKVFTRTELEKIAEVCISNDILCISDEVYEWLVYPGQEHIRIATIPGMWERTITIGSAGKTFSCTGWKLGWAIGPSHLIKNMISVHSNVAYTNPTLLQLLKFPKLAEQSIPGVREAVAIGLEIELARLGQDDSYFKELPAFLLKKRDSMAQVLQEVGLTPIIPEGGYFMMADSDNLGITFDESDDGIPYDIQFVKWMTKEKGIAAIPPTYFYCPEHRHISDKLIRFCFCKEDSTLEAAYQRLREWLK